jgi:uncharacterized protein
VNRRIEVAAVLALLLAASVSAHADFIEAVHSGDASEVQRFIDDGADVNAPNEIGWTPLMDAAGYNPDPDVIGILLKAGANARATNRDGETALDIAQRNPDLQGTDAIRKLEKASK